MGLLTGDVAQKKRLRILDEFTRGDLDILVATDVPRVVCTFPPSRTSSTMTCRMTAKTTYTALVVPVAQVQAVTPLALRVKNMR